MESERRHQPELSRVKPIEKKKLIDNEFDPPDADGEDDPVRSRRLTQVMGLNVARQVSMDPGDGMDLSLP